MTAAREGRVGDGFATGTPTRQSCVSLYDIFPQESALRRPRSASDTSYRATHRPGPGGGSVALAGPLSGHGFVAYAPRAGS